MEISIKTGRPASSRTFPLSQIQHSRAQFRLHCDVQNGKTDRYCCQATHDTSCHTRCESFLQNISRLDYLVPCGLPTKSTPAFSLIGYLPCHPLFDQHGPELTESILFPAPTSPAGNVPTGNSPAVNSSPCNFFLGIPRSHIEEPDEYV
jgi:hypothetical protein